MTTETRRTTLVAALVLGAVTLVYSNHFRNSFQFDDDHTIVDNRFVRSPANIPQIFRDATTSSVNPSNRVWRPVVTASLAIDYWLAGGLNDTFVFHLSTFIWFLVQLLLMYILYSRILDLTGSGPHNRWIAWFAVAWYGVHPAVADTVNYIIQRAEVFAAAGVLAALVIYVKYPQRRRQGLYLLPFAFATMAKAPALVFPALLAVYVFLFEEYSSPRRITATLRRVTPAVLAAVVLALLQNAMTPSTFSPTLMPASNYLFTQPYVVLRYVRSFFVPMWLTVFTDLPAFPSPLRPEVALGFLFLAVLLLVIYRTARRPSTRPIAFGLAWFLIALAPTSLFPLAEVENDHRMFFPFVGLTIAVSYAASLFSFRRERLAAVAAVCILAVFAVGAHVRNETWKTPLTMWKDVTRKSPGKATGFINLGVALLNAQDAPAAYVALAHAETIAPSVGWLQMCFARAAAATHRYAEAEQRFLRAIRLDRDRAEMHYYYALFLIGRNRLNEALGELDTAITLNPDYMGSRYAVLEIYNQQGLWAPLKAFAADCLRRNPDDPKVLKYLELERRAVERVAGLEVQVRKKPTPDGYLGLSTGYFQIARYSEAIAAARDAIRLRPDFAEAYNNIAAASASMGKWDDAIKAAEEAVRIQPDFAPARNNLAYARAQKERTGGSR